MVILCSFLGTFLHVSLPKSPRIKQKKKNLIFHSLVSVYLSCLSVSLCHKPVKLWREGDLHTSDPTHSTLLTPPTITQPMEVYVDDETKLTLHGLQQHYVKLADKEKNRKLFDLLDKLEFNQVCVYYYNNNYV